jgi:N-acetylglucosaminyldiphosphoundecaprenol N-acetyl-beta-D-mannosaminyltransferase
MCLTSPPALNIDTVTKPVQPNELGRDVYGVLGIPIDLIDMAAVLRKIETAAAKSAPFLISTANLNFLVTSRFDNEFRESLLISDLCTADGMAIVWIAQLLGVPIRERIAGSDIFEALKSAQGSARLLKVFLFGGAEGIAAAACDKLNAEPGGMRCVGSFYPGFCTVDEMSTEPIIDTINSSNADFLVVALGAKKGQEWLRRNHDRLHIPIRVHLGAAINFQAGSVRRAPLHMRKWGLEWLWRIKEEPQLWKRYWHDGIVALRLVLMHVLPLMILTRWHRFRSADNKGLMIKRIEDHKSVIFEFSGVATVKSIESAVPCFENALAMARNIVINLADTRQIDTRFLGLLLMLNKQLKRQGLQLGFTGVTPQIARVFRLNGFGFLLHSLAE